MKKLLSIIAALGITTSSTFSIIACVKTEEQVAINKAIEALKNKELEICVTDGNNSTVEEAIKNNDELKTKLGDSEIKIESMKFTAAGTDFTGTFADKVEYEVTLNIKKETKKTDSKAAQGKAKFKIKINILSDKEQIKIAKEKLDKIKAAATSIEMDLTAINIVKLIEQIKKGKFYTDIFKDKVKLEGDLNLKKDDKNNINDNELINDATVFVLGKIKINQEMADFKFSIKLKNNSNVSTDKDKVEAAENNLKAILNAEVQLATAKLNGADLKTAILSLPVYTNAINGVTLQGDLTLKRTTSSTAIINPTDTVTNSEVITVEGTVKSGTETKKFAFVIKIKEVSTDKDKVEAAENNLKAIVNAEVQLATAKLNGADLKTAILLLPVYTNAINGVTLQGDLTLKRTTSSTAIINPTDTVTNSEVITVEGTVKSGTETKKFAFVIKIKEVSTDKDKVEAAENNLKAIVNAEVQLATAKLNGADLKTAILSLPVYINAINGVTLQGDFILKRSISSTAIINPTDTVTDNEIITVEGIIESGTETKNFAFAIKIKEVSTDKDKVEAAENNLKAIVNAEVQLATAKLNGADLKTAILSLPVYTNAINGVTLQGDLTLKRTTSSTAIINPTDTVTNSEIITVEGTVKSGTETKKFAFVIKIKEVSTDKDKVEAAENNLKAIVNAEVQLATAKLNGADLKTAILSLPVYINAINGVTLQGDFILKRSISSTAIINPTDKVTDNEIITVEGIIESGTETKNFAFAIKIKEVNTDKDKVEAAKKSLEAIDKVEVQLATAKLNGADLRAAILSLPVYINAINGVTLQRDFILKRVITKAPTVNPTDTVAVNEVITVRGVVESGTETERFLFTVRVKV